MFPLRSFISEFCGALDSFSFIMIWDCIDRTMEKIITENVHLKYEIEDKIS